MPRRRPAPGASRRRARRGRGRRRSRLTLELAREVVLDGVDHHLAVVVRQHGVALGAQPELEVVAVGDVAVVGAVEERPAAHQVGLGVGSSTAPKVAQRTWPQRTWPDMPVMPSSCTMSRRRAHALDQRAPPAPRPAPPRRSSRSRGTPASAAARRPPPPTRPFPARIPVRSHRTCARSSLVSPPVELSAFSSQPSAPPPPRHPHGRLPITRLFMWFRPTAPGGSHGTGSGRRGASAAGPATPAAGRPAAPVAAPAASACARPPRPPDRRSGPRTV